ncbi:MULTISPECIES: ABC transporter ATP-binding protein [unclassified Paenibacillus]|uniref:ABC transporter ATP-binding protein n=1 Tax=unclassified Paenibacillus TaxID=185978 RepID=UPI0009F8E97B|nr:MULTISPECIES: ABC transporter ATP-binding protein [unclassified Paenibacillus]
MKFPGSGALLFEDLSLTIREGEKVLLLGPSGCGKSTLLQTLAGLIPEVVEVPMKAESRGKPASFGYLFQDPDAQFCMPYVDEELAFVLENLQVPREEMKRRIAELLLRVGLDPENSHAPIASLSGGMKQRLAMASLLALEPDVWFLDEPSSLLDPEGTREIWETVKRVTAGKTVIIVEHKIDEIVDFVGRVVMFDEAGRIQADGAPALVFRERLGDLQSCGIWYPGVWEDYMAGRLQTGLPPEERRLPQTAGLPPEAAGEPLLSLRRFEGCHGKLKIVEAGMAAIWPGDWVAVIGRNGAGKSTLLSALMQLIPTHGEYMLDGRQVSRLEDVVCQAAYVFQNPELQFISSSVFEEIAFNFRRDGEPEESIEAGVTALLDEFGLAGQRGQHPYQLSLGQKRRLSVAAATVKAQRLLLLDEPTFGQDAAHTFALLEKLEQWRQNGMTIVMVTHDMDIVRHFATQVWTVENGAVKTERVPRGGRAERTQADEAARPTAAAAASPAACGTMGERS